MSAGALKLSKSSGAGAKHASYVFPLPKGVKFSWGRTDMGVDIETSSAVGKPILAIGNARILAIKPMGAFGPTWMSYKLLDGPAAGKTVFIGHSGEPLVKSGQRVVAGQPIIKIHGGSYGGPPGHLEIGWGNPQGTNTLAAPHYSEGQNTAEGRSFRKFLNQLQSGRVSASGSANADGTTALDQAGNAVGDIASAAADATPLGAMQAFWEWAQKNALEALLFLVLAIGGAGLAAFGIAKTFGIDIKKAGKSAAELAVVMPK